MTLCEPKFQVLDRISRYHYFDTPDGYDVHLKVFYCFKQAFRVSTFFILQDILAVSQPVGLLPILDRAIHLYKPWISCALTYPIVANVSCLLRKKDDPWNHVLAGAVTTMVLGRYVSGGVVGIIIWPVMIGCGFYKNASLEGWRAFSKPFYRIGEATHYNMSIKTQIMKHGIVEERPKSWTSLENYMGQK